MLSTHPTAYRAGDQLRQLNSFHEKAGASQDGFVFSYVGSLPLSHAASCRHPSIRTRLWSDFSARCQLGRARFSRCCYLIIDLGSPL